MSEKNELETTFRMFATFYVMKHRRVWNKQHAKQNCEEEKKGKKNTHTKNKAKKIETSFN